MATTKKYLDSDGLVQYTGKVKKAINDASYTHGVTDIDGTTTAPSVDNTVNATATQRSATFTKNGGSDTFPYYDTTYGTAVAGSKDGLMSRTDKTKLDGIATGAEANVQSDWNQTTTTADDYIKNKPDVNKVKVTSESGSSALPILVSHTASPTSGNDYEAGYNASFSFKPSNNTLLIGTASLNETSYSGRATKTEFELAKTGVGGNGAEMVGYEYLGTPSKEVFEGLVSVNDALSALIIEVDQMTLDGDNVSVDVDGTNIEVSSGDSLDTAISAIDDAIGTKQDTLTAGTNITFSGTGNTTINAADEKVKHTSDTSTTAAVPMLLAGTTTNNGIAGAKYNSNISFKPSINEFRVGGTGSLADYVTIADGVVTLKTSTSSAVTLTPTNYGGTAAMATADGNGNNIANTYATQAALSELSQKWTGQFVVVRQTGDTSAIYTALSNIIDAIDSGQEPSQSDLDVLQYGYIYLLDANTSSPNVFDEYIKVRVSSTKESIEKIGTTDAGVDVVSLTPAEINTIWSTTAAAS